MPLTILDRTQTQSEVNILDNGGFEIWQRGNSFAATSSAPVYTADRWYSNGNAGQTIAITKETSLIDSGGLAALKVVATNANSNAFNMVQTVENKEAYFGKTLTLSVRVKTTVANAIQVGFYIGTGANYAFSSFHTGSGNYETLTVTGTLGASFGASFNVYVGAVTVAIPNGGTFYVDSAMLTLGSSPVAFIPTIPAIDLLRCMRFFQVIGPTDGSVMYVGCGQVETATHATISPIPFHCQMRISGPTCTVNNQTHFQLSNSSGAAVNVTTLALVSHDGYSMAGGCNVASGLTAGAATLLYASNPDAQIYVSADL